MQLSMLELIDMNQHEWTGKRVMIGLSGGINSMAVLCYLATLADSKPAELYLFYAHFDEHSPGTREFVHAGVEYAQQHFEKVHYTETENSVLDFFKQAKMIPHPMISPCTRLLKIEPMQAFMRENSIDVDLVGYVRSEQKRIRVQQKRLAEKGEAGTKAYPIRDLSDDECFQLVAQEIGWYPDIYRLLWRDKRIMPFLRKHEIEMAPEQFDVAWKYAQRGYGFRGDVRVFKHNNCLPCKNMHAWEMKILECFYPEYHARAATLAAELDAHWGRKDEYLDAPAACSICAFD